jgi:hypothetical protein
MQGPPVSEVQDILMTSGETSTEVEVTLRLNAAILALAALYGDLLRKTILNQPPCGCDRKAVMKYNRILLNDEAYLILLVIWRESSFVSEECLQRLGFKREFPGRTMTAHGLATKLATSAETLAKTNARIRSVGIAAAAYGLIERDSSRDKSKPLIATLRLHQFFVALSHQQLSNLSELMPVLALMNVGINLPQQ